MAEHTLSSSLQVNVVTPRGPVTSERTKSITAPGELGEFEVLPGHVPFLTALHPGVLVIGDARDAAVYAVARGYLRVDGTGAVEVLVEKARAGGDVDTDDATRERDGARAELEAWQNKPQNAEWQNIKDRFDWAQAQLDARGRTLA